MDILNSFETDALKEIGSIGMGNATTSLSKLVNRNVRLNLSDVGMLQQEKVSMLIPESITMAGVMLRIEGELRGVALLLFEFNNAVLLSSLMLGESEQVNDPTMHESALAELGNILAGSYIGALTSFLDMEVRHRAPEIAIGPILNVLKRASVLIENEPEELLNIETMFMVHDAGDGKGLNTIYGDMFLLLDPASLDKLRESIGKMLS
jgi:chemotaxis protein CheC